MDVFWAVHKLNQSEFHLPFPLGAWCPRTYLTHLTVALFFSEVQGCGRRLLDPPFHNHLSLQQLCLTAYGKIRWYITEDCVCAQMSLHRALEMAHNPPDLWISAASLSQVLRPVHRHQRHFSKVVITHYLPTRLLLSGRPGILDTNYDVFLLYFFSH